MASSSHHAPQPRFWVALGRIDRDRTDLDRPEAEPGECPDRSAVLVEAGGQPDRSREVETGNAGRRALLILDRGHRPHRPRRPLQGSGCRHREVMRALRIEPEHQRTDQGRIKIHLSSQPLANILRHHSFAKLTIRATIVDPMISSDRFGQGKAYSEMAARPRAACGCASSRPRSRNLPPTALPARGSIASRPRPAPTSACCITTSATRKISILRCSRAPMRRSAPRSAGSTSNISIRPRRSSG